MLYVIIVLAVLFALASALLAAAETAVLLLAPGRIHRLIEAEKPGAVIVGELADKRHRLRAVSAFVAALAAGSAAVAGIRLANAATGAGGAIDTLAAGIGALVALLVAYTLCQALPRTIAVSNPERIALELGPIASPLLAAIYPLPRALGAPWKWLVSVVGAENRLTAWAVTPVDRVEAETPEDIEREDAEEALLEAVSDFAEKVVREVMVPRTDMGALPDTASVTEAVELLDSTGFSRVPVYHDSIDDVRGILYAKDLLVAIGRGGEPSSIADLARPPYFVPETKPVEELLVEMRSSTHIAIVADEYGGTAGLVTLEDLLEEIVGDISDEYDQAEPLLVELADGTVRVDARLPIDDLNDRFGTDIEIEADSVGGLFTEVAGRIPDVGDSVQIEGLSLTVTDLEGTRLRTLTVQPVAPPTIHEGDADA